MSLTGAATRNTILIELARISTDKLLEHLVSDKEKN
jgi:hypothetical protein